MKKFNKKTLIIGMLIFFGVVALVISTFAQNGSTAKDLEPPTNLFAVVQNENDVHLFWDEPTAGDSTYLHWDNGINYDAIGNFMGPSIFEYATKWEPDQIANYDGWNIISMRFYVVNPLATVKLKVWTGIEGTTEIYSQDVTNYNLGDWTEIFFDTPVSIDASDYLWFGLYVNMPVAGAFMGVDEGPAVNGYGNNYRMPGGNWYQDFDANWNLQIQIDGSQKETKDLLGYNIYRNDVTVNSELVTNTSYVDENVGNGIHSYYVTAVYDDGESDPSNTVQVDISNTYVMEQDSLALVDLYNNCNGPNWTWNENWLVTPVVEWQNVTVVGDRVTDLFMSNNNLTGDIPESFGNLTALVDFHATSNSITSIPETFGNLESLEVCWLGFDNEITSLPESFGNLTNLVQLHIGFLDLGTLPESFGNLVNLEWLALGDAGLNSLPESFGNLISVESCFLWGNNLTYLPDNFGGMESLNYLSLYENQLTGLPESFGDLDNLQFCFLDVNQLESLPESFGYLASLDSLYLDANNLTQLPESFGNLSDLNYLSIAANNLTSLPASFSNLATIQEIYLNNNQLIELPEDIGNLGNTLMAMGISYNNITSLPESIDQLTNIYSFFGSNNQIGNLPVNIGNMANLHYLGMENNSIESIPESFGNLSALGYISLMDNNINGLPESFGNLNADTVLLTNNNIPELPSGMLNKSFDYLWVEDNNLQFGSIEPLMYNVAYQFNYDPQAMIGNDTIIGIPNHTTLSYTIEVTGSNNIYKWYKDGTILPDQTSNTLYIENASYNDEGTYVLKVTNTIVSDLELVSYDVEIEIVGQQFDLEPGFQFISSAVDPTDPNMTVVMADILNSNLDFVRNSAGQMLRKIGPVWVNGIGNWVVEEGYLVKMFAADSFTICGTSIAPETPIVVESGFQFVSFFPAAPMDALVAFETIVGDDLDFIRNSAGQMLRKIGPVWVNGIGDALPGEGYLVKMFAPGQIIYPEPVKLSGKTSIIPSHLLFEGGNAAEPVYTMYIKGLEPGDEVAAYNGDVILGSMTVTSDNVYNNALPVFSQLNNGQGYVAGETISLKVWSNDNVVVADFEMESVYNSYISDVYPGNDGEFSVVNVTKDAMLSGELLVYPNPATDVINITSPSDISNVTIFNYVGQPVYSSNVNSSNVQINSNDFKAGIYIIRIQTCRGLETQKVTIK